MNKLIYKIILLILLISIHSTVIIASTVIPLGLKPFDFLYDKMEKFEATHQDNQLYTISPYIIEKNKIDISPLSFFFVRDSGAREGEVGFSLSPD